MKLPIQNRMWLGIGLLWLMTLNIGCVSSRNAEAYSSLFRGATINWVDTTSLDLEEDLLDLVRPQTNAPLKLAIYRAIGTPKKEKGIRRFLRKQFGQAPRFYEYEPLERSRLNMEQWLRNRGYFEVEISWDSVQVKRGVKAEYSIKIGAPYFLQQIDWPSDTFEVGRYIQAARKESLLRSGTPYALSDLESERNRLTNVLSNQGFYGFSPDNFFFYVDTLQRAHAVDLYLRVKMPADTILHHPVRIGTTEVYTTYELGDTSTFNIDTVFRNGLVIYQSWPVIRPEVLDRYLLQNKGELYDAEAARISARHMLDIGVFQFINQEATPRKRNGQSVLDRTFFLTPREPQEVGLEVEANTRSGNFIGSALRVSYLDRNLLGGAERFTVSLSGGVETLLEEPSQLINTLEGRLDIGLSIPRLIAPFRLGREGRPYLPRSRVSLETIFQRRTGFFTSNAVNVKLGYQFQPGAGRRQQWNPVSINYTSTYNTSAEFESLLTQNPSLDRSFRNIFILSTDYRLELSPAPGRSRHNFHLLSLDAELAGNLAYGLSALFSDKTETYGFFGSPFSQFAKANINWRWYRNWENTQFVTRVIVGAGLPYGNADVLPFPKQFFAGGSTDLRAFPFRGLGPGTVQPSPTNGFFDQTGEFKLALNAEYRFPIFSYLKGAAFVDGGNVWWLRDRPEEADAGRFHLDRFYREIAIGTGLGLRIDIDFVVLRLDLAFPLYKPYLELGDRWVLEEINLLRSSWRKENLIWNLAIGYPF